MKKIVSLLIVSILSILLSSCAIKTNEFVDSKGDTYKYKLELTGKLPNSSKEIKFVVLTNDNKLTFDTVSKSLYSNDIKDSVNVKFSLLSQEEN